MFSSCNCNVNFQHINSKNKKYVCLGNCWLKFDLEFDLKFEISDGKNLVKFLGRTFLPARKARKISGRISGQISEQSSEKFSEKISQTSQLFSETSFSRRAMLTTWEMSTFRI